MHWANGIVPGIAGLLLVSWISDWVERHTEQIYEGSYIGTGRSWAKRFRAPDGYILWVIRLPAWRWGAEEISDRFCWLQAHLVRYRDGWRQVWWPE